MGNFGEVLGDFWGTNWGPFGDFLDLWGTSSSELLGDFWGIIRGLIGDL